MVTWGWLLSWGEPHIYTVAQRVFLITLALLKAAMRFSATTWQQLKKSKGSIDDDFEIGIYFSAFLIAVVK